MMTAQTLSLLLVPLGAGVISLIVMYQAHREASANKQK